MKSEPTAGYSVKTPLPTFVPFAPFPGGVAEPAKPEPTEDKKQLVKRHLWQWGAIVDYRDSGGEGIPTLEKLVGGKVNQKSGPRTISYIMAAYNDIEASLEKGGYGPFLRSYLVFKYARTYRLEEECSPNGKQYAAHKGVNKSIPTSAEDYIDGLNALMGMRLGEREKAGLVVCVQTLMRQWMNFACETIFPDNTQVPTGKERFIKPREVKPNPRVRQVG